MGEILNLRSNIDKLKPLIVEVEARVEALNYLIYSKKNSSIPKNDLKKELKELESWLLTYKKDFATYTSQLELLTKESLEKSIVNLDIKIRMLVAQIDTFDRSSRIKSYHCINENEIGFTYVMDITRNHKQLLLIAIVDDIIDYYNDQGEQIGNFSITIRARDIYFLSYVAEDEITLHSKSNKIKESKTVLEKFVDWTNLS